MRSFLALEVLGWPTPFCKSMRPVYRCPADGGKSPNLSRPDLLHLRRLTLPRQPSPPCAGMSHIRSVPVEGATTPTYQGAEEAPRGTLCSHFPLPPTRHRRGRPTISSSSHTASRIVCIEGLHGKSALGQTLRGGRTTRAGQLGNGVVRSGVSLHVVVCSVEALYRSL